MLPHLLACVAASHPFVNWALICPGRGPPFPAPSFGQLSVLPQMLTIPFPLPPPLQPPQMREEMGRNLAGSFNSFVLLENTAVMRSHLEATSYISGNVEKGKGGNQSRRRG